MGMYTECFVSGQIKAADPAAVVLRAMLAHEETGLDDVAQPDHPFFRKDRKWAIGHCSSYYFQPKTCSRVWVDDYEETPRDITHYHSADTETSE